MPLMDDFECARVRAKVRSELGSRIGLEPRQIDAHEYEVRHLA